VFSTLGGVLVIIICMDLFERELAFLVEFDIYFYLPWFQEEYDFLPLRKSVFWLLPS
jgi:hypothetical protein